MDTEGNGTVSIRSATKMIRKLRISDDCILMVKSGTEMAQKENMDALATAIGRGEISGVIVVVVDDFSDLESLSEGEMRKYGWYKFDTAAAAIMDRIVKERENEPENKNADS